MPRDEQLWKLARKRAEFKRSVRNYLIINAFLWGIWYFSTGRNTGWHGIPWPLWVMLGWGVALGFQYMNAYGNGTESVTEKEYQKLKREKERSNH